jgi:hypothetical protein
MQVPEMKLLSGGSYGETGDNGNIGSRGYIGAIAEGPARVMI